MWAMKRLRGFDSRRWLCGETDLDVVQHRLNLLLCLGVAPRQRQPAAVERGNPYVYHLDRRKFFEYRRGR